MKRNPALTSPLYIGAILIFTSFSAYMLLKINELSENPFLSVAIIQLFIFLIPTAFYCAVGKISFASSVKLRFSVSAIPVLLESSVLFVLGCAIMKYVGYFFLDGAYVDTPQVVSVNVFGSDEVMLIISMVLLPSVLEEIVFRGILIDEYRRYGDLCAVLMSAICFAFLHFSLENFLYYLFAGIVFGLVTTATDSCIPAMILHMLNNAAALWAEESYMTYIKQLGGTMLFLYITVALFLLFAFLLFASVEHLYSKKAYREKTRERFILVEEDKMIEEAKTRKTGFFRKKDGEARKETPQGSKAPGLKDAFLSPTFIILVLFFLIKSANIF